MSTYEWIKPYDDANERSDAMRRPLIIGAATVALAGASVGGALAFGFNSSSDDTSTIPVLGPQEEAQMSQAAGAGPYSVTCLATVGSTTLSCVSMKDEDVIPALRRGEDVYGRTVIGFPGGAAASDASPMFDPTDLVCSDGTVELTCSPVTAITPTVRTGAKVFVVYRKHDVTFDSQGRPTSHLDAPSVALHVEAAGG